MKLLWGKYPFPTLQYRHLPPSFGSGDLLAELFRDGVQGGLLAVDITPNGNGISVVGRDRRWRLLARDTLKPVRDLPGHANPIYAVTFNGSGNRAVTLDRSGKIFLWAPRKDWLQEVIKEAERSINEAQTSRQHLNTYKARHLRAKKLKEAFLREFPEEDHNKIHLTVAPWGNHLLYRANEQLSARILNSLIKLDKLPEKVR